MDLAEVVDAFEGVRLRGFAVRHDGSFGRCGKIRGRIDGSVNDFFNASGFIRSFICSVERTADGFGSQHRRTRRPAANGGYESAWWVADRRAMTSSGRWSNLGSRCSAALIFRSALMFKQKMGTRSSAHGSAIHDPACWLVVGIGGARASRHAPYGSRSGGRRATRRLFFCMVGMFGGNEIVRPTAPEVRTRPRVSGVVLAAVCQLTGVI